MLRWLIRTSASVGKKNKCQAESSAASRSAKDAVRKFDRASRERDSQKQINYLSEGMSNLAQAVERSSNSVPPLAELAVYAAVLTESIESGLDNQTKDIVTKMSSRFEAQNKGIQMLANQITKYEQQSIKTHLQLTKNIDLMTKILEIVSGKPKKKK
tara:strand:+ start:898 stop:1368 length:471 start_codon:yes stop_codon:yes gene_type:complete